MMIQYKDFKTLNRDAALSLAKECDFYKTMINNSAIKSCRLEKDYRGTLVLKASDVVIQKEKKDKKSKKQKEKQKVQN